MNEPDIRLIIDFLLAHPAQAPRFESMLMFELEVLLTNNRTCLEVTGSALAGLISQLAGHPGINIRPRAVTIIAHEAHCREHAEREDHARLLEGAARDSDPYVRAAAVWGLASRPTSIGVISELLRSDPSSEVRNAAAFSLAKVGSVEPVVEVIASGLIQGSRELVELLAPQAALRHLSSMNEAQPSTSVRRRLTSLRKRLLSRVSLFDAIGGLQDPDDDTEIRDGLT